ncbi:KTSC domain-containing protein [Mesorhizobium silamurunense]|uniref:KTSC domain-containing protein n=1 Tax=Mesorhizobium silamurunense TaxID=499528 RepID=UPI0031B9AE1F
MANRTSVMPSTAIRNSITIRRRRSFRYGSSREATAMTMRRLTETYAAFAAAPSKGRFFNEFVRDRYSFRLVKRGPRH